MNVKLFYVLAAYFGWPVCSANVKAAFLIELGKFLGEVNISQEDMKANMVNISQNFNKVDKFRFQELLL